MNGSKSVAQGANGIVSGSMASGTENAYRVDVQDSRNKIARTNTRKAFVKIAIASRNVYRHGERTMSDYISKEDISRVLLGRIGANESCLNNARKLRNHEGEQYFHNLVFEDEQIASLIEGLPSADVRPNIHGHWRTESQKELSYCSECGFTKWVDDIRLYKFCPNCGLKMDREEPEEIIGIGNADKMGKLVDNLIKAMDGEAKGEKGEI